MLTVYNYLDIRKAHAQGESIRSICRRLHHAEKTIRKAIASESGEPTSYKRKAPVGFPKLGRFVAVIVQILKDDETAPRKQRHTARRIFERLRSEHGYDGSYYPVRRYLARQRRRERETFIHLDYAPGRRLECDFGEIQADYPEGRRVVPVFMATWSFSQRPFMVALPTQRTESILHGMVLAFEFFGCLPWEVWWDNPKTVATEVLRGRERVLNPNYAALASHYRFDPLFCLPRKGQEKSDVERTVYALERRACTPVPRVKDDADLNRQLLAFCVGEQERIVSGQTQSIGRNFELEKQAAMALPAHRFEACVKRAAVVDKYQFVRLETNCYSVPRCAAFEPVTIKAYIDRVEVVHRGTAVASHARSYGRHESVVDPLHYLVTLGRKPACLDHSPVFRDWKLPAVFAELRQTLQGQHGPQTGTRHYIRVLQLLSIHSIEQVAQAMEKCRHRPALTAEMVAQEARKLSPADSAVAVESEIGCRVQVPLPDLRRFDQLLFSDSREGTNPSEREADDERPTDVTAQAQSQDIALADDVIGIRQAVA